MPRGGSGGGQPGPLAADSPPWVPGKAEPCSLACRDSPLPSQELQVLLTCHKPLQMGFLMGFGPSERFLFPKQDHTHLPVQVTHSSPLLWQRSLPIFECLLLHAGLKTVSIVPLTILMVSHVISPATDFIEQSCFCFIF